MDRVDTDMMEKGKEGALSGRLFIRMAAANQQTRISRRMMTLILSLCPCLLSVSTYL